MNTKPILFFTLIPCVFMFALANGITSTETAWFWTLVGLPAGSASILLVARPWKD